MSAEGGERQDEDKDKDVWNEGEVPKVDVTDEDELKRDEAGDASASAGETEVEHTQAAVDPTDPTLPSVIEPEPSEPTTSHRLLPSPMHIEIPTERSIEEITSAHGPESPTTSLITSLRSQLSLLSDQTTALNTKLIEAIGRHSDLEDTHVNLQQSHKELQEHAETLAAQKAQWEESMNTGLLVERSQIKDEMQRLAAGLVEEERRRGSAEVRRQKVEEEVDELAASLFDQANTMVAAERMARTQAETRLKSTEDNLAAAEAAIRDMQLHLQSLPASTHSAHAVSGPITSERRYLASHLPFTEFISFVQHLRSLRPLKEASKAMFPPPAITTLLAQPFIARAVTEDHDPTIRLDAAPDLSYFSRRNVGPAIIAGELIIEPVSASTIIVGTTTAPHEISCSLCGKPVFPQIVPQSPSLSQFGPPPSHPQKQSRFSLKPFFNTPSPGGAGASPSASPMASPSVSTGSLPPVYVFRVNKAVTTVSAGSSDKEAKVYPLCRTGWCLERLRAACELWHFVRTGIIHPVWHGDDGHLLLGEQTKERDDTPIADRRISSTSIPTSDRAVPESAPPPLPERKKSGGWGLGFKLGSNAERPNSGAGWFSRSGTPPRSPVGATADGDQEAGKEVTSGLEPAIDLEPPTSEMAERLEDKESNEVPTIHRVDASPPANAELGSMDEKTEENTEVKVPRTASQVSVATSNAGTEEVDFSTPKTDQAELPDGSPRQAVEGISDEMHKPEDSTNDDPKVKGDGTPADPATPIVDLTEVPASPAPPPIPRRAANRMSAKPQPRAEEKPEEEAAPSPVEEPIAKHEEAEAEASESEPPVETAPTSAPPLPPLPPRHPKTPVLGQQKDVAVEGEKRYMKEDSDAWEDKTWRMVVKLKEGMWKARIGVNDEVEV